MGIQTDCLRVLSRHIGLAVHLQDLTDEVGFTSQQVSGAMTHLKKNPAYNISSPSPGIYVYKGLNNGDTPNVSLHSAARVVAVLRSGTLLIEVEGILYSAKEISLE